MSNCSIFIQNKTIEEEQILESTIEILTDETAQKIPTSNCSFKLKLTEEEAGFFIYNQPFSVNLNEHLYQFYCHSIEPEENNIYSIEGVDAIGVMAEQNHSPKMYYNPTTADVVLADIMGNLPYTYDSMLTIIECSGFIPQCSRREALRHFCIGAGVYVSLNSVGELYFRPYHNYDYQEFKEVVFQDFEVLDDIRKTNSDIYSKISVDYYRYSTSSSFSEDYVEDSQGVRYYYIKSKYSETVDNFPTTLPERELYIEGEYFVGGRNAQPSPAANLVRRLKDYYQNSYNYEVKVVSSETPISVQVGIGSLNLFGRPSSIVIDSNTGAKIYKLEGIYKKQYGALIKLNIAYKYNGTTIKNDTFYGLEDDLFDLEKYIVHRVSIGETNIYRCPITQTPCNVQDGETARREGDITIIDRVIECEPVLIYDKGSLYIYECDAVVYKKLEDGIYKLEVK